ncbi:OLC1v1021428C1 [Oldenlandia corymbosa var. corymbosa]|uniref:OLC1v1021428C1 n=1 Tax=Oldenlandia corymbosa var. corymbosa TaxID=529605 RepID=A0AAV1BVM8_OLDCO|nr:OLC1v1021428C1 [Oldenlandia corymbosa var. corymbosa]
MQEALSYRTTGIAAATGGSSSATRLLPPGHEKPASVPKLVADNAVIAFGRSGCCMCFVVKQLLLGHGVNPVIHFVDEDDEAAVLGELSKIGGGGASLQKRLLQSYRTYS